MVKWRSQALLFGSVTDQKIQTRNRNHRRAAAKPAACAQNP